MSAAGSACLIAFASAASAAAVTPNNVAPPGGGGCTLNVTGDQGDQSFTGHITDSCGYSVRVYVLCDFVFDGMNDRTTKYSGSTTAITGTEKASCDVTDDILGHGWQWNAGYGWNTVGPAPI
ncbi:MAG: hypothetical protein M3Y89_14705 [Actinomycetota bacterium]|nr:hypothetical protein [Actinomycetota bacterium]